MAHTTKVNGTDYTIKGGKVKVDGTDYSIKGGKAKINGTDYSISFGKVLTISGVADYMGSPISYVMVNEAFGEELQDGTYAFDNMNALYIGAYAKNSSNDKNCRIYLNGTVVQTQVCNNYNMTDLSIYNTISIEFTLIENKYTYCYITTT